MEEQGHSLEKQILDQDNNRVILVKNRWTKEWRQTKPDIEHFFFVVLFYIIIHRIDETRITRDHGKTKTETSFKSRFKLDTIIHHLTI